MNDQNDIAIAVPRCTLRNRRLLISAAAATCAGLASSAHADNYTWNGAANGFWNTPGNWLVGVVAPANAPGASDSIINPTSITTLQLNPSSAVTVTDWTMTATTGLTVSGSTTSPSSLAITGTLSKTNTNSTLNFRNGASQVLTLSIATVTVSGGTLIFGEQTTNRIPNVTMGNVGISGSGVISFAAQGGAGTVLGTITGTLTMTGNGSPAPTLNVAGSGTPSASAIPSEFRIGAIESFGATTAVIQANPNSGSPYAPTVVLTGTSGTTTFAGVIRDGSNAAANNILSLVKANGSTQILSGNSNAYRGGTTINGGALLVTNTTGSGTGFGRVVVNTGGTLGGTGRIAPTVAAAGLTINSGGKIAPGVGGIGALTVDLTLTTGNLTLASGAGLEFELGAPTGLTPAAPSPSDRLILTGAIAGDVTFNNNVIDFLGTGGQAVYKLFDSSLTTGTAWNGLTFSGQTITAGLSYANLAPGLTDVQLFRGNGTIGEFDDIYIATPEPGSATIVMGALGLGLLRRRRMRV